MTGERTIEQRLAASHAFGGLLILVGAVGLAWWQVGAGAAVLDEQARSALSSSASDLATFLHRGLWDVFGSHGAIALSVVGMLAAALWVWNALRRYVSMPAAWVASSIMLCGLVEPLPWYGLSVGPVLPFAGALWATSFMGRMRGTGSALPMWFWWTIISVLAPVCLAFAVPSIAAEAARMRRIPKEVPWLLMGATGVAVMGGALAWGAWTTTPAILVAITAAAVGVGWGVKDQLGVATGLIALCLIGRYVSTRAWTDDTLYALAGDDVPVLGLVESVADGLADAGASAADADRLRSEQAPATAAAVRWFLAEKRTLARTDRGWCPVIQHPQAASEGIGVRIPAGPWVLRTPRCPEPTR